MHNTIFLYKVRMLVAYTKTQGMPGTSGMHGFLCDGGSISLNIDAFSDAVISFKTVLLVRFLEEPDS